MSWLPISHNSKQKSAERRTLPTLASGKIFVSGGGTGSGTGGAGMIAAGAGFTVFSTFAGAVNTKRGN